MMDYRIAAVRSYLRLAHQAALEHYKMVDKKPRGYLLRENQLRHASAVVALIEDVMGIAGHDPDSLYHVDEEHPF